MYICQAENNEGISEVKIQVHVDGQPGAPVASVNSAELTVVEGQIVTMECQASGKMSVRLCYEHLLFLLPFLKFHFLSGSPPPVITWSKLRAPLPWKHTMVNGVLTITSVGRQDSGEYICNATNINGYSEAYMQMEVECEWTHISNTLRFSVSTQV